MFSESEELYIKKLNCARLDDRSVLSEFCKSPPGQVPERFAVSVGLFCLFWAESRVRRKRELGYFAYRCTK